MATRKDKTTQPLRATDPSAISATNPLEAYVIAFAEQVGRIVGTVQARTEGWADRRNLTDQLTRIRDEAADLLDRLGSGTAPAAAPAPRRPATPAARNRGKVDAPGKTHRKAPTPTPGIKHSDLMIPKVTAAQKMRRGQRG
jgi:hypothetical protein